MHAKPGGTNGGSLTLGVKGKLSNQEMDVLRQKLAQAVAYDHVPNDKRAERQVKAMLASKPMTKIYRKVHQRDETALPSRPVRPGIKPLATIQYEQQFQTYDTQRILPAKKGISTEARTVLQDEYITKPRAISSIPRNLMPDDRPEQENDQDARTGKRLGPAPIQQVFIM